MYTEKDFIRIARRENNKKRNYLIVNPLQGKHIPVKPKTALDLFQQFADSFIADYKDERLLFIGFAETATAIGAAAALRAGAMYIQTTRETVPGAEYLFFSEEHSHAVEQKLVRNELDQVIGHIDRIIFIEDEITTGKTILNMIRVLKREYSADIKFSAASLLNGMDEYNQDIYNSQDIRLHYFVKTDHRHYAELADSYVCDGTYVSCRQSEPAAEIAGSLQHTADITEMEIGGWIDARRLVLPEQYGKACSGLRDQIGERLHRRLTGKVLVLGTEEFMYPALSVAEKFQSMGADTWFHATTRSPILVCRSQEYPLHVRYELRSLYDGERRTFVYDLDAYDMVIVITDAPDTDTKKRGRNSLLHALMQKNQNIIMIRWGES